MNADEKYNSAGRVNFKSLVQITRHENCWRVYDLGLEGFIEYKRREFCNDIPCPIQVELNKLVSKSEEYEKVRMTCKTACRFTTYEFHQWLIEKGYLIIRSKDEGGK